LQEEYGGMTDEQLAELIAQGEAQLEEQLQEEEASAGGAGGEGQLADASGHALLQGAHPACLAHAVICSNRPLGLTAEPTRPRHSLSTYPGAGARPPSRSASVLRQRVQELESEASEVQAQNERLAAGKRAVE